MTTSPEQNLIVRRIVNPLQPRSVVTEQWAWHEGITLADYFPVGSAEHVVSLSGQIVDTSEYHVRKVALNEQVVVCAVLQGSGDSKTILRLVAMIAIAVFAPAMAGAMLGAGAPATAVSMATLGINVAGSLLVNALLPPPSAAKNNTDSTASFGIDQQKNTSEEGVVVPVYYGRTRVGGNIINLYVENDGRTQFLYALLNLGEGPVASAGMDTLRINDQPASNFSDVEVQFRNGYSSQTMIPWFADTITPFPVGQKLSDTIYTNYTTTQEVDRFRIDLVAAAGLVKLTTKGSEAVSVPIFIDYRKQGTTTWIPLTDSQYVTGYTYTYVYYPYQVPDYDGKGWTTVAGSTSPESTLRPGSSVHGDSIVVEGASSDNGPSFTTVGYVIATPVSFASIIITDNTSTAIRKSVLSPVLEEAVYEVRARRGTPESTDEKTVDEVFLTDFNEIILEDVAYVHSALLGVKIRLTDQLSNMPTLTVDHGGRLVKTWLESANVWSDPVANTNPAWATYDVLTNTRFGGGIPESRIDLASFREWAIFCDADPANRLEFNGGFTAPMTVWDAAQAIARTGHAQVVNVGTRWSVVIERAASPTAVFSVANMVKDSFKLSWAGMQDRANEIEVSFADRNDDFKDRRIRVYDPAALAGGKKVKTAAISLPGVTDAIRAGREGMMQLNLNRYIQQVAEFSVPSEALACRVGDVVLVQHDMPEWGLSGRFEAGSTATELNLDRSVELDLAKTYALLAVFDTVQRSVGTVIAINGNYVRLSSYLGEPVRRILINGSDREVASIFSFGGNGYYGVVLHDVSDIAVGNAYALYDTDVIEERPVFNTGITTSQITLTTPFSSAPAHLAKWMFGPTTRVSKPFRVRAISSDNDLIATLKVIEYNASVYNLSGYASATPNYSSLTPYVKHVGISGVTERLIRVNSAMLTEVTVGFFSINDERYRSSTVYVSIDGAAETVIATEAFDRASLIANDGAVVTFRVVAQDSVGSSAPRSTAPTITHTVLGKSALPADVTGFIYRHEPFGVRFSWTKVADIDVSEYELRFGPTWDGSTLIARAAGTSYFWKVQLVGTQKVWIKAVDSTENYSQTAAVVDVVVQSPSVVSLTGRLDGQNVVLEWLPVTSDFVIDRYEIRTGADWESGVNSTTTYSNSFTEKANWLGSRRYMVAAIDGAGNRGAPGTVDIAIHAPSAPVITSEVIDNNVLLRWSDSTTSLPIERYEIRSGASWASGVSIGDNGNGRFAVFFEQQSGVYTYWVMPFDTAGNAGNAASTSVTVSQPPDYVLRANWDSEFDGTSFNLAPENGSLFGPLDTVETWAEHFTTNGWTTPQDQINAGYPNYWQPGATTAYYEEILDYGALITSSNITVTLTYQTIAGSVTVAPTISVKKLIGNDWTTPSPGSSQIFASDFRYLKVRYDLTGVGNDDLIKIDALNFKLSVKLINDAGEAAVLAADPGGTTVNFNLSFTDVTSITVTPKYNSGAPGARIAIYDFTDTPNPTSFKILLYNTSGSRVDGDVSWSVKGA